MENVKDISSNSSNSNSNNSDKFNFFIDLIRKSRLLRRKLGQWSHAMFFNIYLADYLQEPMANFHRDMFRLTEANDSNCASWPGLGTAAKAHPQYLVLVMVDSEWPRAFHRYSVR